MKKCLLLICPRTFAVACSGMQIIRHVVGKAGGVFLAGLFATFFLSGCSGSGATGPDYFLEWQQINQDGFGNPHNSYAWSMAAFRGSLFVGTFNLRMPLLGLLYFVDVYVPGMSEGCEIWAYDPSSGLWTRAAWAGINNDPANIGAREMVVFGDRLYVGTINIETGMEIWRTRSGSDWVQVGEDGLGNRANVSTRAMHVFGEFLYVGTENRESGGQLWRSRDGEVWEVIIPAGFGSRGNFAVAALATFEESLYAGTWNPSGFQMWQSRDGVTFESVLHAGTSLPYGQGLMALCNFQGRLFGGTGSLPILPLSPFLFSSGEEGWGLVGERGFGDRMNKYFWTLASFQDRMYLGTFRIGRGKTLFRDGFDLYETRDGQTWEMITQDGFGDLADYGVRTMEGVDDTLYLGTAGAFGNGCRVWVGTKRYP